MIKKWLMKWYTRYWVYQKGCSGMTGVHEQCSKCPAYIPTNNSCEE